MSQHPMPNDEKVVLFPTPANSSKTPSPPVEKVDITKVSDSPSLFVDDFSKWYTENLRKSLGSGASYRRIVVRRDSNQPRNHMHKNQVWVKGGDDMDDVTGRLLDRLASQIDKQELALRDHRQEMRDLTAQFQRESAEREARIHEDAKLREERILAAIQSNRSDTKETLTEMKTVLDKIETRMTGTEQHVRSMVSQNMWGRIATVVAIIAICATVGVTVWSAVWSVHQNATSSSSANASANASAQNTTTK